jgi:hypothetical protein
VGLPPRLAILARYETQVGEQYDCVQISGDGLRHEKERKERKPVGARTNAQPPGTWGRGPFGPLSVRRETGKEYIVQVDDVEGLASRIGTKPCVGTRQGDGVTGRTC